MPKKFDLLVFDWDGTIMDSATIIATSLQAACSDLDLPIPPLEGARHIVGLGLKDALSYTLPGVPESMYPDIVARFRHHYWSRNHELALFEGVRESLEELREEGFLLAIATGNSRQGLERVLGITGLGHLFHSSRCADETRSKPDPTMLLELMDELDTVPERTLMIGDTTHDLQMAINARVSGMGVSYGAHEKNDLLSLSPIDCVDNFMELHTWLKING